MKEVKTEGAELNLIKAQIEMAKEGKQHLKPLLMQNYATNIASLTLSEIEAIEQHIEIENCERCRTQIEAAKRAFYL